MRTVSIKVCFDAVVNCVDLDSKSKGDKKAKALALAEIVSSVSKCNEDIVSY